ncbi:MBL fold metallo-hydrolase [Pseudotabrizicola alkalilacus]|uniref:MBL fold metallo-hydrolase n=1 Tax=Pseudotabrizicola alkalilacus TaxID=2305252 RepID=A0A411Z1D6_9RHOB|nr:MBL fold metallo-hydrolase [Pseudotabrizicola alkalilacus]RGP36864.1 MBL fold metallo-hydrolase [Pseudotabrizicola alkalilacus]
MQAGVAEQVAKGIRRILAPNPSAMTGPGTNTYILGHGAGVIVVDPGPAEEQHLAAILATLDPSERVTAILVTHAHKDHSAAAPRLSALTAAPVFAFGDALAGRSPLMQRLADSGFVGGGEGVDLSFRPDRQLTDGEGLICGDGLLRVIHTPGHMGGHICLGFGDVLLSGDHAMGWASSLISPPDGDMAAYMASLDRLLTRRWSLMLPGHGPAVTEVAARLQALSDHRRAREAEVMAVLRAAPATPADLTRRIYHDIPAGLHAAATRNVLAHLIDLAARNAVICRDLPGPDTIFTRSDPL